MGVGQSYKRLHSSSHICCFLQAPTANKCGLRLGSGKLRTTQAELNPLVNSSSQAEGPKLLQALPAAVSDVYVYRLAQQLFGPSTAQYAVSTIIINCIR